MLTGTISHEMMTPLNAILNLTKIVARKIKNGSNTQDNINNIKQCC